jgi:hypothetical protein
MTDKVYIKRLEAEIEKLRQIIEDNGLKAGCYDFLMDHLNTAHNPCRNVINISHISDREVDLVISARYSKNDIYARKIINDMIEVAKTDAGR